MHDHVRNHNYDTHRRMDRKRKKKRQNKKKLVNYTFFYPNIPLVIWIWKRSYEWTIPTYTTQETGNYGSFQKVMIAGERHETRCSQRSRVEFFSFLLKDIELDPQDWA